MNSRYEKQSKEVFRLLAASHELHYALVVANRRRGHDCAVGPTVPHENLAASRLHSTQIKRGRVIYSSSPAETVGVMIEIKAESITVLSHLLVHKIFQVLSGQIEVRGSRRITRTRSAKVVPARPLRLGARNVRIGIEHFALGVGRGRHQALHCGDLS